MKSLFGLVAAAAAAVALVPYSVKENEETGDIELRSLLLKWKINKKDEEGKKTFKMDTEFAGAPTKEDIEEMKAGIKKGVDKVKEKARDFGQKFKEKMNDEAGDGDCSFYGDCSCNEDCSCDEECSCENENKGGDEGKAD